MMELQDKDRDQILRDHEVRITRLEDAVVEITTELRLLNQRVDALPEQINAVVKAQLAESLMEWRKDYDAKFEKWSLENDGKLEKWRTENDGKLERWRTENDGKLAEWRTENDGKLEKWRTEIDVKLEKGRMENGGKLAELERKMDARFASQGKWFRWIAGLLVSIFLAVIFTRL